MINNWHLLGLTHPSTCGEWRRYRGEWMAENPTEVMTIDELAAYLRIPKSTLYKLVREGKVPCQKVGRHWRFRKPAIDRWLEEAVTDGKSTEAQS